MEKNKKKTNQYVLHLQHTMAHTIKQKKKIFRYKFIHTDIYKI